MEHQRDYLNEKQPGVVALIGIIFAREGNEEAMRDMADHCFTPVMIHATDSSELALKVSRYALDATISAGDPGPDRIAVALDVAIQNGVSAEDAARGVMKDRRDR